MHHSDDRLLAALRRIRALQSDERDLEGSLLDVVRSATSSTSAKLARPLSGSSEAQVGRAIAGAPAALLERRFRARSGVAVLTLERPASEPFDDDAASMLEVLGGEVVLRLDQARTEAEAARLRREIELLRAVSRTDENPKLLHDVADRAASELLAAFTGADVLIHVLVDDRLELVARRSQGQTGSIDPPPWIWSLSLDGPATMAIAAHERRTVRRSVSEVDPSGRSVLAAMGIGHLLVVPLLAHEVILGTLTIAHGQDELWDAESLGLVEEAAAELAVELARRRTLEAERRRVEELAVINDLAGLLAGNLELSAVLATAAGALVRAIDVPRAHVALLDEAGTRLEGVVATEAGIANIDAPLASIDAVALAIRTIEPVVVHDAASDLRTNKACVTEVGVRSLVAIPLVANGESIGAIVLVETRHERRFAESEVARARAVANVVAPAVTNAKMFEDLRRSYQEVAETQAALVTHERLAALGELSAVIAHEIRNPLAVLFNSLSELRRHLPAPPEEARLLLDIVGEETWRLNRIVSDLLDFVRPYEAHPRLVDLDELLQAAVEGARRAAPGRDVEIRTESVATCRELFVDGTMLQQALLNLIVNALQASPRGGAVIVRAEAAGAERDALRFQVADEGRGLDAATSDRLFQPFFTTKATGIGLGLALVRRMTDALGGTVSAESRTTGGALFTLTVPLRASTPEA
jgi:signal transduction histidine kinase